MYFGKFQAGLLSLAICALTVLSTPHQSLGQSDDPLSTDFVLKDSFFFVSIQPAKLAALADKESDTTEYVLEKMIEFTGLDIKKIDQVLIQIGSGDDDVDVEDVSDGTCIVIRFSDDIDMDEFEDKVLNNADVDEDEIDGKTYYKSNNENSPGFFFPNKRTLIIGEDNRLQMVADASGMSKGVEIAGKLSSGDQVGIVFECDEDNEKARELMTEILDEMDFSSIGLDDEALEKVQSGHIRVNLKSDTPIRATLVSANDASDLMEAGEEAIEMAQEQLEMMEEQMANAPPSIAESMENVVELMGDVLNNSEFSVDGNKVNMVVKKEGGMTKVVDMVAEAAEQILRMMEQFGGGF